MAVVAVLAAAVVSLGGCTGMQNDFMRELLNPGIDVSAPPAAPVDESAATAGVKEALRVATERALDATAKTDGFLADRTIRIPLPAGLQADGPASAKGSASAAEGCNCRIDRFDISMNRAAERAADEARGIFLDALGAVKISHATDMTKGCDPTATEYFRAQASDAIMARFRPIVAKNVVDLSLYDLYASLDKPSSASGTEAGAAAIASQAELIDYVSQYTLDGLFTVLGREERRIRQDPDARTSRLLRRVFGNR